MPTLPFCKPAYHRIPRQGKLDRQARLCYFLNFGYHHGSDCVKIMDAETGRTVHSRDVTWHQPREPLISPAPTVESKLPQSPSGAATPEYVYIQPAPTVITTPTAAPVPASDNAAPTPPRHETEPIRDRVVRELGHESDARMPGRTRGETRAMRESPRSMGLMSHAALAQGIATREAFDEAFHEHELPPPDADLPTAPASDVPTPSTVAEADSLEHAAIRRNSRTREFRGLLQAHTFGPAWQPIGNVIDAKWLFNWKSDEFGWVSKAKSRLVARGFKQREGIDLGKTFAPTVSGSCVRLLSAIAYELDLDVCHFDVEQAFVQSKLDEDVFLRLPRGCGRLSGKVVRLNKSLYGLKQASRSWHAHLTTCLNTLGFQQCLAYAWVFRLVEEVGVKSSIDAAWKKGEKSASVSSGSDGMPAAVLSPGGFFIKKKKGL